MVPGPVLLLVSDIAARFLLPTGQAPVAVVTTVIGGGYLSWLLVKEVRKGQSIHK